MRIVYLIAGQGERDAIAQPLAAAACQVKSFQDVEAFFAEPELDPAGCIVVDLQPTDVGVTRRLRAIREPLPIIVLSTRANVALAVQAMKEGAADVLQKPVDPEKLCITMRAALEASRAQSELARKTEELVSRFRTLSARERDVVDAVLGGCGNREVATHLGIKPRTVEIHRSNAMSKLGARNLADLVRIWLDVDANTARLSAE